MAEGAPVEASTAWGVVARSVALSGFPRLGGTTAVPTVDASTAVEESGVVPGVDAVDSVVLTPGTNSV